MINKSTNAFTKGLNLSTDKVNQPKDTYSYALNAIKEDVVNNPQILSNEKGFSDYFSLEYTYVLLGSIYLGKKDYILFIKNNDGDSEFNRILLLEDQTYRIVLDNIDLNFNSNFPIKGTYRINYKGERIIYWVDGLNEDRVLNIDNGDIITNLDNLSIDIKYVPAVLESKTINDNNGSLLTGTYEFYASYKSEDNAITPWFILSASPSYIIDDASQNLPLSSYISVDGSDSGVITTKSITLNIANLDTNFSTLRLGIVKTIDGTSTGYYIDDINYSGNTKEYLYTGFIEELPIGTISDFFVDPVRYYASNAIAQSANRLLRSNNKTQNINIDYQEFANNIKVDYYIDEELVMSMPNSTDYNVRSDWWKSAVTKYTDKKSLMRDEVYSLGVAFGLKKEGVETLVYHIPGRSLNDIPISSYSQQYTDNDNPTISVWDTNPITENGETIPRWKVENTAALATDGSIKKLAYWESDEVYPEGFNLPITGSTNNGVGITNIRHHKMPSAALEPLYRREDLVGTYNFYKRSIGLNFSNIVVPDELKDNISYIRFYITSRQTDSNKSIIGKGIFVNSSLTKITTDDRNNISTNYWVVPVQPYNDLDDPLNNALIDEGKGTNTWNTTNNYYHSFYSPDTTMARPTLNVDRVTVETETTGIVHYYNTVSKFINAYPYGPSRDPSDYTDSSALGGFKRDYFYNDGKEMPVGDTSTGNDYNLIVDFQTTYKSISILNSINKIPSTKSRRKIKRAVYVPYNGNLSTDQLGGMDNPYYSQFGPSNVLIELDPTYSVLGATETTDTSVNFTDNDQTRNINTLGQKHSKKQGTFHFHTIPNPLAVFRYGSIKRSNPSQYGNVTGLEYLPTDLVVINPTFDVNNTLTASVSGLIGDSFVDIFSIKRVRSQAKINYTYVGRPETHVGVSSFFTESNINHRLRYAEGTGIQVYYPRVGLTTPIKDWLADRETVTSDNYYKYNTDYHKESSKVSFSGDEVDADLISNLSFPTRIIYSEKLLDETRTDSYRSFLANNYRDLPKNRGFITHLFNKGQELYSITRDSIWKIFSSNQTIKTNSGDNATIGTGEFFSLDPVEILSIDGGYAGSSSKMSLVETPYGYLYIDRYKGRFILFTDQPNDIALKDISDFVINNYEIDAIKQNPSLERDFDNPLSNYGYIVGYEPQSNRILITKLDYTLSPSSFDRYVGLFDPNEDYVEGDIYIKDDLKYYEYISTTPTLVTIAESSDLSDFIPSTVEDIDYSFSSATNGNLMKDPLDQTKLIYTPDSGYIGSDSFNITSSCLVTPIEVTIEDAPTVPDYEVTIPDTSVVGDDVVDVNGTYITSLTYSIISDNEYGTFNINSSTGLIEVADSTNLDLDFIPTFTLVVRVMGTDGKFADSNVIIHVIHEIGELTAEDQEVEISQDTPSGTLIYTIIPATYPGFEGGLVYDIVSESNPGIFISNLDNPDNLTISVADGVIFDGSIQNTYTINYIVEDNNDSSIFSLFTVTIKLIGYENEVQSQDFTRNNCGLGSHGTISTYTVPAGTYTSYISVSDANAMALADIAANGQNYANDPAHGSCIVNVPNAFSFTDQTGLEVNTLTESNNVTITGTYSNYNISITDGEYQINGGAWTSSAGIINVGDNVKIRRNTSNSYSTLVSSTLTIGGVSDTWNITTRVANDVTVNWSVDFGLDPTTYSVLGIQRNGVDIFLQPTEATGTLPSGTFKEGDSIFAYQVAYPSFRWAPNSNANFHMTVNGSTYFDGNVTDQTPVVLQETPLLVIPNGTMVIDISSTGSSTAIGYFTESLHTDNYLDLGDVEIDVSDNDEAGLGLQDLEPGVGVGDFAFNVKGTTGNLTVTITNNKATPIDYSLTGELGYIKTGTIVGLGNVNYSDVTKGGITIQVSDSIEGESCGVPIPYTGGQTYPTIQVINLGSGTGTVVLDYDAFGIPDKFIVEFDGVEVINTGYRGDSGYQSFLDASLASYGASPETIMGRPTGSDSFVKSTATTTATVYVYAPISGTAWSFTLQCPA